jgi:hypothetical protein
VEGEPWQSSVVLGEDRRLAGMLRKLGRTLHPNAEPGTKRTLSSQNDCLMYGKNGRGDRERGPALATPAEANHRDRISRMRKGGAHEGRTRGDRTCGATTGSATHHTVLILLAILAMKHTPLGIAVSDVLEKVG